MLLCLILTSAVGSLAGTAEEIFSDSTLTENNCYGLAGFIFTNQKDLQVRIQSTNLIKKLKSLLDVYKSGMYINDFKFPHKSHICGDIDAIAGHGYFFSHISDKHLIKDKQLPYLLNNFILRKDNQIVANFAKGIISMSEADDRLNFLASKSSKEVNKTMPSYTGLHLVGGMLETIPLMIHRDIFSFFNKTTQACLLDPGYNEISLLWKSNQSFITEMISKLWHFLNLVTVHQTDGQQSFQCNIAYYVDKFNNFQHHNPQIANIFYDKVNPNKAMVFRYGGNDCDVIDNLSNYILLQELLEGGSSNNNRIRRNILDILLNEGEVAKMVQDTNQYVELFHSIQHNEKLLNQNQAKIQAWSFDFQEQEHQVELSLESLRQHTQNLMSDSIHNKLTTKVKTNYYYDLFNAKLSYIHLLQIHDFIESQFTVLLNSGQTDCQYQGKIMCRNNRPIFKVQKDDLYIISESYTLQPQTAYQLFCLPNENNDIFQADKRLFILDKSMFLEISGTRNLSFVTSCLSNKGICQTFYEKATPNIFHSCNYISTINTFFVNCQHQTKITLLDRSHILVGHEVKEISLFNFPIKANNITINIRDLNIIDEKAHQLSYFKQHQVEEDHEELTFQDLDFGTTPKPIDQLEISTLNPSTIDTWILPRKLSWKHFFTWTTTLVGLTTIACCMAACCSNKLRNIIFKFWCCLPLLCRKNCIKTGNNKDENKEKEENQYAQLETDITAKDFVRNNLKQIREGIYQDPSVFDKLGRSPLRTFLQGHNIKMKKMKQHQTETPLTNLTSQQTQQLTSPLLHHQHQYTAPPNTATAPQQHLDQNFFQHQAQINNPQYSRSPPEQEEDQITKL